MTIPGHVTVTRAAHKFLVSPSLVLSSGSDLPVPVSLRKMDDLCVSESLQAGLAVTNVHIISKAITRPGRRLSWPPQPGHLKYCATPVPQRQG